MSDIFEEVFGPQTESEKACSDKINNDATNEAAQALLSHVIPSMVEARNNAVAEGRARPDAPVDGMVMVAHEVNGLKYGVMIHVQLGPCLDTPTEGDTLQ